MKRPFTTLLFDGIWDITPLFTGNFLVICGHRCGSQLGAGEARLEARQNSAVEEVTPY